MNEYEKQANDFLKKTGTTFKADHIGHFYYFDGDEEKRDVYQITLTRGEKSYSFRFGQSIAKSNGEYLKRRREKYKEYHSLMLVPSRKIKPDLWPQVPTPYDVLACLTKYDPGTFTNFCAEFGYDVDSRKAEKTYFAIQDEYENVNRLFGDVMEELEEIN